MPVPLLQIDAFTRERFGGNPAAVCLLDGPRPAEWMQAVAAEMNLSETAFLVPTASNRFDLRWFTPTVEVALCGHATLASAHAVWATGRATREAPVTFDTRSGPLVASPADEGAITIDLPAREVDEMPLPDDLVRALGVSPRWTGAARKGPGDRDYLVEVSSEAEVRDAQPDFAALRSHAGGIILTAAGQTAGWDVVSRYFAPAYGIDEDPVTGSAHCALATFWTARLGRRSFVARQVSRRGGTLHVTLDGSRVRLTGHAVTVLTGELEG
ncbi:MAG TPA: PhzF family phenazine biosynthesis protein [Vicinamibacterales bacterium]